MHIIKEILITKQRGFADLFWFLCFCLENQLEIIRIYLY